VSGLCSEHLGVHEREGKKGGLKEGERWPQAWTPRFMTDCYLCVKLLPTIEISGLIQ